jgi:hypothetical protein
MTPSPYLHGGLFGYPAVFDPGHSTLSSVVSWDPSPSPCVPVYGNAGGTNEPPQPDDEPARHSLHLHLPTPRNVTRFPHSYDNRRAFSYGGSVAPQSQNNTPPPPCIIDNGNIDPALFMDGFPTPGPARRTMTDAQWDNNAPSGSAFGVPSLHLLLHLQAPSCPASPQRSGLRQSHGGMMFAPVPVPMGGGRLRSLLCGMQEMDAEAEVEAETEERTEVEVKIERGRERWESPEAWLVPSKSVEEADGAGEADDYHP